MEFISFKIMPVAKNAFEQTFKDILQESKIICNQWEFHYGDVFTIAEIPKDAVDKMTLEQIELLNSFT